MNETPLTGLKTKTDWAKAIIQVVFILIVCGVGVAWSFGQWMGGWLDEFTKEREIL